MRYRYESRGKIYELSIERHGEGYRAIVDGQAYDFSLLDSQPGALSLRFEGRPVNLYWAAQGGQKWVSLEGCTYLLEKPSPHAARRSGQHAAEDILRAPMPAQVRAVEVRPGDQVAAGQTLLVLEAMKMEIRLQAPRAGAIARLLVETGQTVNRDQILVEIQ